MCQDPNDCASCKDVNHCPLAGDGLTSFEAGVLEAGLSRLDCSIHLNAINERS
jgi:hypothetical protein